MVGVYEEFGTRLGELIGIMGRKGGRIYVTG